MASRTFHYLSYTTVVNTSSVSFADASNGGLVFTPADNTTTVVIAVTQAHGNSTSASRRPEFILQRTSGTPKTFNAPIPQVGVINEVMHPVFMAVESWGASPGAQTYQLQTATQSTLSTTTTQNTRIISIELGASDQSIGSYNSRTTTTSSTFAATNGTLTFTPSSTGDYVILAAADIDNNNNNTNATWSAIALDVDGTQYATKTYHGRTNTSSNIFNWGAVKKVNLSNASHTIAVKYKSNGGTATTGANNVTLVAIRADAFDNVFYDEVTARSTTTSGSAQDFVTSTHTPQAVNYVVFASAQGDSNVANSTMNVSYLDEGANPRTATESIPNTFAPDTMNFFWMYNVSFTNSSTTVKSQWTSDGTEIHGIAESAIAWVQLDATPAAATAAKSIFQTTNQFWGA